MSFLGYLDFSLVENTKLRLPWKDMDVTNSCRVKEEVLHLLEKEEFAFERLDDLWRDKVNTTGTTSVRELFERYETERGPLSIDDLKDLLKDLAYVHITCHVFPQTLTTSSTGLSFGNNVASALEGSSSKAAASGFQSSPPRAMVTGQDRLRVRLPHKPSSHDWCPEKTFGTMQEEVQNLSEENERLKCRVQYLEQELEQERAIKIHCQSEARHLQGEVENLSEENERLKCRVQYLEQELEAKDVELRQYRAEFQRQLQQDREANLHQYRQQIMQDRERFERSLEHVERVAEERCALHQQPETRTWIIQRNEVVQSSRVLGEGSWGSVREGTFRGSPVAVKELHSVILSSHNRRLFEREMEILSRCRHCNIVQFMGATSDDQAPLLVTELLDCNLRQLLEQRQLNKGEIISLALDVARGLNCMHCSHPPIVHRDVKSDNILLRGSDNSWIAKVSDFGVANFRRQVMTPNQGTPLYSAPESSTTQHSEPVDVYSFGLLLLEMCIREYPVPDQISHQIQYVSDPRLQELIRRCVKQDPERRLIMDEVIQILTQLRE